ncbi:MULTISPECIES: hypothetical protein [unclassified Bradyrhizobium]
MQFLGSADCETNVLYQKLLKEEELETLINVMGDLKVHVDEVIEVVEEVQ